LYISGNRIGIPCVGHLSDGFERLPASLWLPRQVAAMAGGVSPAVRLLFGERRRRFTMDIDVIF
jgi:hypothetical protein